MPGYDDDDMIDYANEYSDSEEMGSEEEQELQISIAETQSLLGNRKITISEIEESLRYYDYDVNKAVKYLSNKYDAQEKSKAQPKKVEPQAKPKGKTHDMKGDPLGINLNQALSALGKLASQRSNDVGTSRPMSKLEALAKARANTQNSQNQSPLKSVALLDKIQSSSETKSSALSKLGLARKRPIATTAASMNASLTTKPKKYHVDPPQIQKTEATELVNAFPDIDFDMHVNHDGIPSELGKMLREAWTDYYEDNTFISRAVFLPANDIAIKKAFNEKSPDDIVMEAQEGGFSTGPGTKGPELKGTGSKGPGPETLEEEIKKLTVTPKTTRKLDVKQELSKAATKPTVSFVVIGHVDAGKSTLMGRLMLDVGAVDQRTVDKFKKQSELLGKSSFALAWVLDQTEEERKRGVTIDICISKFETTDINFTIVDAPGHKDFVPNMIAGSSQADIALLVVDASTDAFETGFSVDGQTREHAVLARSLGVEAVIVAINKLDTVDWSQTRFEAIKQELQTYLKKVGYDHIDFVPTSGLQGDNVVNESSQRELQWYKGPTLLGQLTATGKVLTSKSSSVLLERPFRLEVEDAYISPHSSDLAVSGRIDSGSVQVGETVIISPSMVSTVVKNISDSKKYAIFGQTVTLTLSGTTIENISSGSILSNVESPVGAVNRFVSRIVTFDNKRPVLQGSQLVLHRGRVNVPCKISKIKALIDKVTGKELKKKPRHLSSGQTALVEVVLDKKISLEVFSSNKTLGRFVLRDEGFTVAAGVVDSVTA